MELTLSIAAATKAITIKDLLRMTRVVKKKKKKKKKTCHKGCFFHKCVNLQVLTLFYLIGFSIVLVGLRIYLNSLLSGSVFLLSISY